jgi:hypothetical protein
MAVNIPVNTGGVFLAAGSSITGSFGGMLALSGSGAQITGLKYINGYSVVNQGTSYVSYPPAESTISTAFGVAAGSKLELAITSCSLAAGSSPVILYQ